jgi:3-oxoacyl-[acyl-carrier-protein] synthase II
LGAAGAIEAIICIKAIQDNMVPPTINTKEIEPEFADLFDFPLEKAQPKEIQYAMSNTFGFGGHIASVILKKWAE